MALEINIKTNFAALAAAFDDLKKRHVVQAARRAMNRSLISVRKESVLSLRKVIKLKSTEIKDKISTFPARGGSLEALEAKLVFSGKPIPLINFIRGSKAVIEQKGIKVKRRRKLRAEITPGKRFIVKKAFIQRARSVQVFKGQRGKGFKSQGAPSIAHLIRERHGGVLGRALVSYALKRFDRTFEQDLKARLNGIVQSSKIRDLR